MKRTAIAAAVAVLLAGTAHAATTEFIIYKGNNFQGASQVIKGEVANLEGGFAGEGSSLVVRGGNWEVCTDDHFRGRCAVIAPGEYPRLGFLNERIVSVRYVGNQKVAQFDPRDAREERREARREAREERREARRYGAVDLYGRPGFRGRSVRIDDNVRNLAEERFDGRASSAVVHDGTWQFCSEPRFEGQCAVLRPGRYPQLAMLDDRVSSMRQLR